MSILDAGTRSVGAFLQSVDRPLTTYLLWAFGVTWVISFGCYALFTQGLLTETQLEIGHALSAVGPTIGALVASRSLRRAFQFRLPGGLPGFLVFSPILLFGLGLLGYRLVQGSGMNWSTYLTTSTWLLPLITFPVFEEIGWRGYLLPRLQAHFSAWNATLYLTGIWALWHLPFFFYRFEFSPLIAVGFFFGLWMGAILLTCIFNASRGSLLGVILFHFFNNVGSAFDTEIIAPILSIGFVVLAIWVYQRYGRLHLSPIPRTTQGRTSTAATFHSTGKQTADPLPPATK